MQTQYMPAGERLATAEQDFSKKRQPASQVMISRGVKTAAQASFSADDSPAATTIIWDSRGAVKDSSTFLESFSCLSRVP
jgi:hypothetical protein